MPEIDYFSRKGRLIFAPGVTNLTLTVPVVGDADFEPDETFYFVLHAPRSAQIAVSSAIGLIRNDDSFLEPPVILGIRVEARSVHLQVRSVPGQSYQLERRPDLHEGAWAPIAPVTSSPQEQLELTHHFEGMESPPSGFFRVVLLP